MAPGRRDGAGCREGAKGGPKHHHTAATSRGEDPNSHQSCCGPGRFWLTWPGQTVRKGKAAFTHPQAVAGSGNKTSPTVGWALTAGPGLVVAWQTCACGSGLAAKQTAVEPESPARAPRGSRGVPLLQSPSTSPWPPGATPREWGWGGSGYTSSPKP